MTIEGKRVVNEAILIFQPRNIGQLSRIERCRIQFLYQTAVHLPINDLESIRKYIILIPNKFKTNEYLFEQLNRFANI
jgi:hypothetical protein